MFDFGYRYPSAQKPLAKLEDKMKKIIQMLVIVFVLVCFGNIPASALHGSSHPMSAESRQARDEQVAREIEARRQAEQQGQREKDQEVFLFVGTLSVLSLGGIIVLFRKRHDLVKALQSTENGVLGAKMKAHEKVLVIILAGVFNFILLSIAVYNGFCIMDKASSGTQSLLSTMKFITGILLVLGGVLSVVIVAAFTLCLLYHKSETKKEEPISA